VDLKARHDRAPWPPRDLRPIADEFREVVAVVGYQPPATNEFHRTESSPMHASRKKGAACFSPARLHEVRFWVRIVNVHRPLSRLWIVLWLAPNEPDMSVSAPRIFRSFRAMISPALASARLPTGAHPCWGALRKTRKTPWRLGAGRHSVSGSGRIPRGRSAQAPRTQRRHHRPHRGPSLGPRRYQFDVSCDQIGRRIFHSVTSVSPPSDQPRLPFFGWLREHRFAIRSVSYFTLPEFFSGRPEPLKLLEIL
jgi:hypothetical protein